MGMTPEEQLHLFAHPQGELESAATLEAIEEEALSGQELEDAEAELFQQLSKIREQFEREGALPQEEEEEEDDVDGKQSPSRKKGNR